jgi:hypothetical protein
MGITDTDQQTSKPCAASDSGTSEAASAVGKCCRISARMLMIADTGDLRKENRVRCIAANRGQAALLSEAAAIADAMLAALKHAAAVLEGVRAWAQSDPINFPLLADDCRAEAQAIRAAIAKATGRADEDRRATLADGGSENGGVAS